MRGISDEEQLKRRCHAVHVAERNISEQCIVSEKSASTCMSVTACSLPIAGLHCSHKGAGGTCPTSLLSY